MADRERVNLDESLSGLSELANKLLAHLTTINDPSQDLYIRDVEKLARISIEISTYKGDDIRENLISIYNLVARPKFDDEEVHFSHLLLDKLVNDVRDSLLNSELAAGLDGFPAPSQINPSNTSLMIPSAVESAELKEISNKVSNIQSEIAAIRVSGTQIGFINFQLEKMEIKVHLSEAIIEMKKWIDALNLEKNISGLKVLARQMQGWIHDKSASVSSSIVASVDAIIDSSSKALNVISRLVNKYQKSDYKDDEIFSESEVQTCFAKERQFPRPHSPL